MWLLKAPKGIEKKKEICGKPLVNGYLLETKQYWYRLLIDVYKFEDVTSVELSEVQDKEPKTAIAIRWGGYGDAIMCLPIFKELKKKYPKIKITLAGLTDREILFKGHPFIDTILTCPAHNIGNVIEDYDIAIDFSGVIASNPDADVENAYDLHFKWARVEEGDEKVPDLFLFEEEEEVFKKKIGDKPYIVFNAEATHSLRSLPFNIAREAIIKLAEKYPKWNIIVTGQRDKEKIRDCGRFLCRKCKKENIVSIEGEIKDTPIQHKCTTCKIPIFLTSPTHKGGIRGQRVNWHTFPKNVIFLDTTIRELMCLIDRAKLLISVDSAPTHIAGALETPLLGIFSSFDGDLRLRYFEKTNWIQHPFRCAPCFQHHVECPQLRKEKKKFPPCMDSISPGVIVDEAIKMLEEEDINKPTPFEIQKEGIYCPICGEMEVERSFRKGEFLYWKCKCNTLFLWPRPTLERLREEYQNPEYNIVYNSMEGIGKLAQVLTTTFGQQFDFRGSIIEIGTGVGWFGAEARRLGWKYTGVEVNKYALSEARKKGLQGEVIRGSIEDGEVYQKVEEKGPFDILVLHNVIEHFISPKAAIQQLLTLIGPQSYISIITPELNYWNGLNTWGHMNTFFACEHTTLFSRESLVKLCKQFKLEEVSYNSLQESHDMWMVFKNGRNIRKTDSE